MVCYVSDADEFKSLSRGYKFEERAKPVGHHLTSSSIPKECTCAIGRVMGEPRHGWELYNDCRECRVCGGYLTAIRIMEGRATRFPSGRASGS